MPAWPSTLPQALNADGYSESKQSGLVRTSVESGPDLVRRRFSAVRTTIGGSLILTEDQWQTLMNFHDLTLAGGSLTFDWHPTGLHEASPVTVLIMRFVSPPSRRSMGTRDLWQVDLQLEALP